MKQILLYLTLLTLFVIPFRPSQAQSTCSSSGTNQEMQLSVPNLTDQTLDVFWIDYSCVEQLVDTVAPAGVFYQTTYDGHEWVFRNSNGDVVNPFTASVSNPVVIIGSSAGFNPQPVNSNCSSAGTSQDATLTVINNTDDPALLFWIDYSCVEQLWGVVEAKNNWIQQTYVGHDWVVRYMDGRTIEQVTMTTNDTVVIDPPQVSATATPAGGSNNPPPPPPGGGNNPTAQPTEAPDFPTTESGCEVAAVTPEMELDTFYRKYCEYEGILIIGSRRADDLALEQAWLYVANMLYNSPEITESLVDAEVKVIVLADDEVLSEVPEMVRFISPDRNIDDLRAANVTREAPFVVITGEENLLCGEDDINASESRLVANLGNEVRVIALTNDLDPEIDTKIEAALTNANDNGLWGGFVTENVNNYWMYGVQAYFNSAFDAAVDGNEGGGYTNTRRELEIYDPMLFELVDSVFNTEDWWISCPGTDTTDSESSNSGSSSSASGPTCIVQAQGANTRTEPNTQAASAGALNGSATAVAQTNGADGFVWYRLENNGWIRSDVAFAEAACANLPGE